jgi:hypothetical protein
MRPLKRPNAAPVVIAPWIGFGEPLTNEYATPDRNDAATLR